MAKKDTKLSFQHWKSGAKQMSLQWVSNGVVLFWINIRSHGYALIIIIILVHKCFVSCTLMPKMSTKSSVIGIHIIKREFYYFCNEYIICEYHEDFIFYSRKYIFLYMHQMLLRYGTHKSGRVPCSHCHNMYYLLLFHITSYHIISYMLNTR